MNCTARKSRRMFRSSLLSNVANISSPMAWMVASSTIRAVVKKTVRTAPSETDLSCDTLAPPMLLRMIHKRRSSPGE